MSYKFELHQSFMSMIQVEVYVDTKFLTWTISILDCEVQNILTFLWAERSKEFLLFMIFRLQSGFCLLRYWFLKSAVLIAITTMSRPFSLSCRLVHTSNCWAWWVGDSLYMIMFLFTKPHLWFPFYVPQSTVHIFF